MNGFDWPGLLRIGVRGLGLRPEQFWRLTPAELMLMLGAGQGPAPLNRSRLEDLARQFPDICKGQHHGGNQRN